jgi:pimeloyl-ACP methyl ester carboxylesterase
MAEVKVRGRSLAFEARPENFNKSALTAVFIPGSGGDREEWRKQLDGLSNRFNIIALELPGHGESEAPGETDVAAYADWVVDFIEGLGLSKVVIVGCSLGSAITQWIAMDPKPWLVGIGLVGAGARLRVHPDYLQGMLSFNKDVLVSFADFALSRNPDPAVKAAIRDRFLKGSLELIHGDLTACDKFDLTDKVAQIALPTIIVVGEDDRLTPPKYSRFLQSAIPGSLLAVIPAAGHLVMIEKPKEFNEFVGDFLEELNN